MTPNYYYYYYLIFFFALHFYKYIWTFSFGHNMISLCRWFEVITFMDGTGDSSATNMLRVDPGNLKLTLITTAHHKYTNLAWNSLIFPKAFMA